MGVGSPSPTFHKLSLPARLTFARRVPSAPGEASSPRPPGLTHALGAAGRAMRHPRTVNSLRARLWGSPYRPFAGIRAAVRRRQRRRRRNAR
jgi:hypothetical protein